jgi:hypothetical protein
MLLLGQKEPMLLTIEENKATGAWGMGYTNTGAFLALEALYPSASSMSYRVRIMV